MIYYWCFHNFIGCSNRFFVASPMSGFTFTSEVSQEHAAEVNIYRQDVHSSSNQHIGTSQDTRFFS